MDYCIGWWTIILDDAEDNPVDVGDSGGDSGGVGGLLDGVEDD